jgi:hypothetical protein
METQSRQPVHSDKKSDARVINSRIPRVTVNGRCKWNN